MVVGGTHRKRRVGRPKSTRSKSVSKRSVSRRRVSRSKVHRRSVSRKRSTSRRRVHRRSASSGLSSKTLVQLRKLAKSAGVPQSRKGHVFKKSSLVRALSGKTSVRRKSHRRA